MNDTEMVEPFNYFDDWIVVKTDDECRKIRSFEVRKKENAHIETIEW